MRHLSARTCAFSRRHLWLTCPWQPAPSRASVFATLTFLKPGCRTNVLDRHQAVTHSPRPEVLLQFIDLSGLYMHSCPIAIITRKKYDICHKYSHYRVLIMCERVMKSETAALHHRASFQWALVNDGIHLEKRFLLVRKGKVNWKPKDSLNSCILKNTGMVYVCWVYLFWNERRRKTFFFSPFKQSILQKAHQH